MERDTHETFLRLMYGVSGEAARKGESWNLRVDPKAGLTAALKGNITIERGRVKQQNFHDYEVLRIDEMPVVDVYTVASSAAPGGIGEASTPPVAPAVMNAVFAATGKRVRSLPVGAKDLA